MKYKKVITRIWHGMTKAEHADEYLEYVIKTGVADYKNTEGNLGWKFCGELKMTFVISGQLQNGTVLKTSKNSLGAITKKRDIMRKTRNIYWNLSRM